MIHLAAESHVDRSIEDPFIFAKTNVMGTLSLLQAAREAWKDNMQGKRFYHVSTDEVYGALEMDDTLFTEETPYDLSRRIQLLSLIRSLCEGLPQYL